MGGQTWNYLWSILARWTHKRLLLLRLCLDCGFFGLFDLGILGFQRHMIEFPFFSEFTQPFPVDWLSELSFIESFKFGDTFIFGHQFLKMTAALSRCSGLKVLRNQFKYFTDSKMSKKILSLVLGGKYSLIMVDEECIFEILLLGPFSIRNIPLFSIHWWFLFLRGDLGLYFNFLGLRRLDNKIDGTITSRHSAILILLFFTEILNTKVCI